jgi:hypothetical protein
LRIVISPYALYDRFFVKPVSLDSLCQLQKFAGQCHLPFKRERVCSQPGDFISHFLQLRGVGTVTLIESEVGTKIPVQLPNGYGLLREPNCG